MGLGGIKHEGILIHMRRPRFAFDHFVCCILFLINLLPPFAPIQHSFNAFERPSFLSRLHSFIYEIWINLVWHHVLAQQSQTVQHRRDSIEMKASMRKNCAM